MNNLTSQTPDKDKIVIVGQKEIEKKQELVGRVKLERGHTLFEINLKEKTIEEAEFENNDIKQWNQKKESKGLGVMGFENGSKKTVLDGPDAIHRKVMRKPMCIYISALNRKNVIKKLVKRGIVKLVKK